METGKRKRDAGPGRNVRPRPYRRTERWAFRPSGSRRYYAGTKDGYTRRSGFYGRFGASSKKAGRAPEQKFFDTALAFNYDATAETAVPSLCLMAAGTSESQRIGRKVMLKSIQIKAIDELPAGAISQDQVNFYLVQDTQCNGAAATWADVFTGTSAGVALRNLANSARFKVLYHHASKLTATAGEGVAFGGDNNVFDTYIKLNIPLEFATGAGGSITDLKSNNLLILAGSNAGMQDDATTCTGNVRVRYTDV